MPLRDGGSEPPRETELQKARRHLREARERLARQEAIVAKLEAVSRPPAIEVVSHRLLENIQTIIVLAEHHVARLEGGIRRD